MKIYNKLSIKNTQKKTISQNFIQSLNILNLTTLQLKEKIYETLNDNPFLQEVQKINEGQSYTESNNEWINNISSHQSIFEFLKSQILELSFSKEEYNIAYILLTELDKNGLFKQSRQKISSKYNISKSKIKYVLSELKNLEPTGIFSESIQESILKQISVFFPNDKDLNLLITKFWVEVQKLDYKKIKKGTAWEDTFILRLFKKLKRISPYPIINFEKNKLYTFPDIEIKQINHEWKVIIENEILPVIEIKVPDIAFKRDDLDYLRQKIKEAKFLVSSIKKRNQTLYKFTNSLITLQEDFFNKGKSYLKPLNLDEMADFCSLHKSTISRIIQNKTIKTGIGIFELKYFFSSQIKKLDNTNISSNIIKQRIKELISKEDINKPLSDMQISKIFFKEEIIVSKRLVNKYRNQIGILPYNKRKFFPFK